MVWTRPLSIADRLLLSFPVGHYGLTALLRVCRIEETRHVPTACIECGRRPRLLVNPDFVERYARSTAALLMLLMHELHHLILGHTRLYSRTTQLDNFIFDAIINSMLTWLMPDPEALALFTNFYPEDQFPECFLRPPPGWLPEMGPVPLPAALRDMNRPDLDELYRGLYSSVGLSCSELRAGLRDAINERTLKRIVLLGDHGHEDDSSSDGRLGSRSPVLYNTLAEAVRGWRTPTKAAGPYHALAESTVSDVQAGDQKTLRRLLRKLGGQGADGRRRQLSCSPIEIQSAVRASDRRSIALRTIGQEPLLYTMKLEQPRPTRTGERVHVYCDVSGSMREHLGTVYGAILSCRRLVHPIVHLFSTEVADVRINAMQEGSCLTTKGTRISCVAAHIRENGVQRAALITDGCVGTVWPKDRKTLHDIELGVALTANGTRRWMKQIATYLVTLG